MNETNIINDTNNYDDIEEVIEQEYNPENEIYLN